MIKLTNILTELLNTFEITALLSTDRKTSITEILDQIRALKKITTVRNITPPEYMTQSSSEHTIIIIKFVTRGDAKQDLKQIKNDILTQGKDRIDLRIPGIKSFKFKFETLKRK
tara:strand:- start:220 stop:561 length:342 start_codon:yes stop_codon:yes gene_type:complete